jgi:BCCT, betaine/carnitine/choline family transporter
LFSLAAPTAYCLVWFCIWGGVGLRQARQGLEMQVLGETYYNNSGHYLVDGSEVCYHVPQHDVLVDGQVVFTNHLPGVTPVCQFDVENYYVAVFHVLYSFSFPESFGAGGGFGPYLSVMFILACVMFFAATANCSAIVIASLAANGRPDQHWTRRMFWLVTVGALTTFVLSAGGAEAMDAVKSFIMVVALPFVILLCYMLQSIAAFCQAAESLDESSPFILPSQPEFTMPVYGGIFNVLEYVASLGKVDRARVELGMGRPTSFQVAEFIKGIIVPFVSLNQVLSAVYPLKHKTNAALTAVYSLVYLTWVGSFALSGAYPGLRGLSASFFAVSGLILAMVRSGFRARFNLRSNTCGDLIASLFFWPQVLTQMRLQCVISPKVAKEEDDPKEHAAKGSDVKPMEDMVAKEDEFAIAAESATSQC